LRADDLADLAASCLRGALPPVDLRAVCLVRAIDMKSWWWLVRVVAKDGGALAQRGRIYIQTRPRPTRDVPRLCGDQQTEK
jgi:hypothetical protein